jgi:hypothetical protein
MTNWRFWQKSTGDEKEKIKNKLAQAIEKGRLSKVRQIFNLHTVDINEVIWIYLRPLSMSLYNRTRSWSIAIFLLEFGADPKLPHSTDETLSTISNLHWYAVSGDNEANSIIRLLLFFDSQNAFMTFCDIRGRTMLQYIDARGSRRAELCDYDIKERKQFIIETDAKWKEYRCLIEAGTAYASQSDLEQHPHKAAAEILFEMAANETKQELLQFYSSKGKELLSNIEMADSATTDDLSSEPQAQILSSGLLRRRHRYSPTKTPETTPLLDTSNRV